jgi:glycosyltransferase involved in cell wall biosynthesis
MKKTLTLSLVIPAFNEEEQIVGCLRSIASQIEKPDEVIVVDNNSTDRTVELIQEFPFVRIVQEKRQGLRYARDTGIAAAKSDLIGRIDADTRLTPDWVAQAKTFFADPSIMAATGPCFYHDMPAKKVGLVLDRAIRRGLFRLDESPVLFGSNMVFRATAWQEIAPNLCTSGEFFEDLDITIHLREQNLQIAFDEELVVGVSSRRLEDDPKSFRKNMSLYTKTFAMHGLKSSVATGGRLIFVGIYPPMKLLRRVYDPETEQIRFNKSKTAPRPTANT